MRRASAEIIRNVSTTLVRAGVGIQARVFSVAGGGLVQAASGGPLAGSGGVAKTRDRRKTIGWLNRRRCLAEAWERLNRNGLAFLRWASIRLMLRKLSQITT
jgi:hypothetical protein